MAAPSAQQPPHHGSPAYGFEYRATVERVRSAGLHIQGHSGLCGDNEITTTYDETVLWARGQNKGAAGFARVSMDHAVRKEDCSPDGEPGLGFRRVCECGSHWKPEGGCDYTSHVAPMLNFQRPDVVRGKVVPYTVAPQRKHCTCSSAPAADGPYAWGPFGPAHRAFYASVFDPVSGAVYEKDVWQQCGNLIVGHLVNVSASTPRRDPSGGTVEKYTGSWQTSDKGIPVPGQKYKIFGRQTVFGSFGAPNVESGGSKLSNMIYKGAFDGYFGVAPALGSADACVSGETHASRNMTGHITSFRTVPNVDYTKFNLPDACYSRETLARTCPRRKRWRGRIGRARRADRDHGNTSPSPQAAAVAVAIATAAPLPPSPPTTAGRRKAREKRTRHGDAAALKEHKRRRELNEWTEKRRQGRTSTGSPGICT